MARCAFSSRSPSQYALQSPRPKVHRDQLIAASHESSPACTPNHQGVKIDCQKRYDRTRDEDCHGPRDAKSAPKCANSLRRFVVKPTRSSRTVAWIDRG